MDDVNDLWPWIQYKEENFLELTIFTRHIFFLNWDIENLYSMQFLWVLNDFVEIPQRCASKEFLQRLLVKLLGILSPLYLPFHNVCYRRDKDMKILGNLE